MVPLHLCVCICIGVLLQTHTYAYSMHPVQSKHKQVGASLCVNYRQSLFTGGHHGELLKDGHVKRICRKRPAVCEGV